MPKNEVYEQDPSMNPMASIINMVGHTRNSSSGPTMFIFKTMLVSTTSAALFGLCAGLIAPPFLGSGMGFMVGSGAGFLGGLWHRWASDLREARLAMREFPDLMLFHIKMIALPNGRSPSEFTSLEHWSKGMERSPIKQSLAIAAVYAAADSINTIRKEQESRLVEKYSAAVADEE
mmetsp:Transcript_7966/g.17090  ORF Transcript_7966/g.17090 Transcript_7966/m.17090 type:complete len:176 (-) Transcript_7966:139-666(-)